MEKVFWSAWVHSTKPNSAKFIVIASNRAGAVHRLTQLEEFIKYVATEGPVYPEDLSVHVLKPSGALISEGRIA